MPVCHPCSGVVRSAGSPGRAQWPPHLQQPAGCRLVHCLVMNTSACCGALCLQVPCPFSGNITVRVHNYRSTAGGWLRLALRNVAGMADINSVQLARVSATDMVAGSELTVPCRPLHLCSCLGLCRCTGAALALRNACHTGLCGQHVWRHGRCTAANC